MPEYTPQQGSKEGHKPNTDTVIVELYRLLAIFLSSKQVAELHVGIAESGHPLTHLESYEEDEITRILLTIAITARVIDDREKRVFELVSSPCGTLVKGAVHRGVTEPLLLREACNKIIRAEKVRFDVDHTEAGNPYSNPMIYLYGHDRSVAWKATLDIVAFAKEVLLVPPAFLRQVRPGNHPRKI